MISYMDTTVNTPDEDEVPLEEGYKIEYSGFAVVLGPWIVHLLEAEQVLICRFVKRLNREVIKKGSNYHKAWVLHYTEDVCSRAYHNWYCKSIPPAQATREIKNITKEADRIETVYQAMVSIGQSALGVSQKGETAVIAQLKSQAAEKIPSGDELATVINESVMTIEEWIEFCFITPDICLEKEMQWPVD